MLDEISRDPQLLKGVLPMLVLALLHRQESYGYELVTRLREAGLATIAPGTVYPVLTRLEREGHLASRLVPSTSGPARKYYLPTDTGTHTLRTAERSWQELTRVVATILVADPPAHGGSMPAAPEPDHPAGGRV